MVIISLCRSVSRATWNTDQPSFTPAPASTNPSPASPNPTPASPNPTPASPYVRSPLGLCVYILGE